MHKYNSPPEGGKHNRLSVPNAPAMRMPVITNHDLGIARRKMPSKIQTATPLPFLH